MEGGGDGIANLASIPIQLQPRAQEARAPLRVYLSLTPPVAIQYRHVRFISPAFSPATRLPMASS